MTPLANEQNSYFQTKATYNPWSQRTGVLLINSPTQSPMVVLMFCRRSAAVMGYPWVYHVHVRIPSYAFSRIFQCTKYYMSSYSLLLHVDSCVRFEFRSWKLNKWDSQKKVKNWILFLKTDWGKSTKSELESNLKIIFFCEYGPWCWMCAWFLQTYSYGDVLLDDETQGSGTYLPELDDPEHCHAHNAMLWDLCALRVSQWFMCASQTFCVALSKKRRYIGITFAIPFAMLIYLVYLTYYKIFYQL